MKTKKVWAVLIAALMVAGLAGCGKKAEEKPVTYEIAMVTDTNSIQDGAFNQAVWDGIEDFVEEKPVSYKAYLTTEDTTDGYLRAVKDAVDGGAKIIIAAGSAFGNTIDQAQSEYPQVSFALIDGRPQDGEGNDAEVRKNTTAITFAEEQAGYLAGYAAVKEGYKKLGFLGGKEEPPVQRFGYGFIQGADDAAKESSLAGIQVCYGYTGTFNEDEAVQSQAAAWYEKGTEVIFAGAGAAGRSIMKAAEEKHGRVIGVDLDQSKDSKTVIFSAVKNIRPAISDILWEYYEDNEFAGGKVIVLDAKTQGVGLAMNPSTMNKFSSDDYDQLYKKLADGAVTVKREDIKDAGALATDRVNVKIEK
ncbi:BMP family ABC transporter substrate-binding protein [Ihubacter massiliensis]|uniref:BMP family ABC transporter substrate-binding protein n=1 Tax=Hominibacterium faecale TaxID=2839743 RepID=A0A9J6QSM2_9FIRM|nr:MULTISPECIES: BMP family ABC transporter substrate-binding protein [Eubacteriales Family XIII. Incertae Sedis]MCI7300551.1 BMP family ABC transporter substrate-binding protein [Clostridia bacterium]MDE8733654.1 BMP family ABC transporter substrate-binding protein [Eubacteriales bacterium DFI.9.88]MDY3011335.1 BMP family ABC transporter substrate-binding protein [Clostridiales Family XIII bacterium]MCO7124037.1 BMP family ABC transporter substrate-binding protein [Ihubacter massiliensis]MCU7